MTKIVSIGSPPIEVHLKRSARARRYSLRISNVDSKVSLTLPERASERDAIGFAVRQEGWLRTALAKRPALTLPALGQTVLYEGRDVRIMPGTGRSVTLQNDRIFVPGNTETVAAKLRGYFKVQARQRLAAASGRYAAQIGRQLGTITLRDTRSRWGSCTAAGNLMYS